MSLLKSANRHKARMIQSVTNADPNAVIRNALRRMSKERNDYSGCPLPLPGQRLVIEPTFKYADLSKIGDEEGQKEEPDYKVRNIFWSFARHCRVAICEDPDGKIWWAPLLGSSHTGRSLLNTLGACDAWGIEQEHAAVELLGTMLRHRQLKQYLLAGMFLETSVRSGVTYLFRRLRPTVALKSNEEGTDTKILCALCMHPIGYYEESWGGCMCPTDDVIAHLALMRGDERMFWRRCNQHEPYDPASGL